MLLRLKKLVPPNFRVALWRELCYPFVTRRWGNAVPSLAMTEWGASRILALRKHASMTQAQFATWLGVTIKQVKYLEHQRRNPSGPTRRLLDILALELRFDGAPAIQVLGASPTPLKKTAAVPRPKTVSTKGNDAGPGLTAATPSAETAVPDPDVSSPAPNGDAFVWL